MYTTPQKSGNGYSTGEIACPSCKAYFRLMPDSKLRVSFIKRQLPVEVIQRYFGNGHFEMSENFELPSVILVQLGIQSYKINPGFYTIQEDQKVIRVDF